MRLASLLLTGWEFVFIASTIKQTVKTAETRQDLFGIFVYRS